MANLRQEGKSRQVLDLEASTGSRTDWKNGPFSESRNFLQRGLASITLLAYYAIMIIRLGMILGFSALLLIAVAQRARSHASSTPQEVAGTQHDCGPASLYFICRTHGVFASLAELKQQTILSKAGTNLMSLKVAATHAGFQAEGIKVTAKELHRRLTDTAGSAILHLPGRQHFVAVLDCSPQAFCIADPNTGCAYWDFDQLAHEGWQGHALLIIR